MPRRRARSARKIRYAVVGLGHIAQVAVLPAFRHARGNSELVALVSDDDDKLRELGKRYRIRHLVGYDRYDELLASGQVDAVYIALPNHLHREYTLRAAKAGVHVLCEKPLAVTEADCTAMVRATDKAGVLLMTAYRLHFERSNMTAVELIRSKRLGEPRIFSSVFTMQVAPKNIRLASIDQGGGTLYDIGVYCINAARYLFRAEPEQVMAFTVMGKDRRFRRADEMTSAMLRFPGDRLASFTCSFGAAPTASFEVVGTKGHLRVESAYEYAVGSEHTLSIDDKTQRRRFGKRDQFAPELVYFSGCILRRRRPEPSGEEGLADVRIIRALYRSASRGRPVRLAPFVKKQRPSMAQELRRPPIDKPALVEVRSASGD
jgi:glucose-fructose oxidoreductase